MSNFASPNMVYQPMTEREAELTRQLSATQAERDTYRKALEEISQHKPREHYIGDHGMGGYEECSKCEDLIDIAREALKEDV